MVDNLKTKKRILSIDIFRGITILVMVFVNDVASLTGSTFDVAAAATYRDEDVGDAGKKAILGQDSVDWAAVLRACQEVGGTEWITIEQERYPDGKSPMECSGLSLAGLKKLM